MRQSSASRRGHPMNEMNIILTIGNGLMVVLGLFFGLKRLFRGSDEMKIQQPLKIVMEKALEEKFVSIHESKRHAAEIHRRMEVLEEDQKELKRDFKEIARRLEEKGEERACRIYERMDSLGAQLRGEIKSQTDQLIHILQNS